MSGAPRRGVPVGGAPPPTMLERMTLILDCFATRSAHRTLKEVADRTRLPRSTAHRILVELVRLDWLASTPSGYRLGGRALALGTLSGHGELRATAAPLLWNLRRRTGLAAHLGVLDGAEVVYLDKIGALAADDPPPRVGGRAPAHATALGRSVLARLTPEQVESRLSDPLERPTSRTVGDLAALHRELDRIRRRGGLALERGECFAEVACVACAVVAPEGPLAGISVSGPCTAVLERAAPLVAATARRVSAALASEAGPSPASHLYGSLAVGHVRG